MSARVLRSTAALRYPAMGQRAFSVSRQGRQTTQPPQTPKPEPKGQNTYVAVGAAAVGLGFVFWHMTGKPEKANEVANDASKKISEQ